MSKIEQLEKRIKDLERKVCCKTQFFDTVDDLPAEGSTGVIYVTNDGNIYVWNGVDYTLNGLGDAYYTNSYVERLKALGSNVQYSNYLGTGTTTLSIADSALYLESIYINKTTTLNGVAWFHQVQGNYTADNYNGVGLYSYDLTNEKLTLIANSTNDGDIWKAAALTYSTKDFTSPITINNGIYYVGFLFNYSAVVALPAITRYNSQTTTPTIYNTAALSTAKIAGIIAGHVSMPLEVLNVDIVNQANGIIFNLY